MKQLNNDSFIYFLNAANKHTGINEANIEKDFYICRILSELEKDEEIEYAIFRGGTSLSKCWKVVDRFSEDIDFSIAYPVSISKRRQFKYKIKEICDFLDLKIINYEKLRSRTAMNRYEIVYPSLFNNDNAIIYLEMSFFSISLFITQRYIQSYIGEQMQSQNIDTAEYGLEPFKVKTQTLQKTFADKVFALCDYALTGRIRKGSRHIYDLYKLYPLVKDDPELKNIIDITRYDRMKRERRPSSYADSDVNQILKEITDTGCFAEDYNMTTYGLLNEKVGYDSAINTIKQISEKGLFTYDPDFDPIDYLIKTGYIDRKDGKQMKLYREYYEKPFYIEDPKTPKTLIK